MGSRSASDRREHPVVVVQAPGATAERAPASPSPRGPRGSRCSRSRARATSGAATRRDGVSRASGARARRAAGPPRGRRRTRTGSPARRAAQLVADVVEVVGLDDPAAPHPEQVRTRGDRLARPGGGTSARVEPGRAARRRDPVQPPAQTGGPVDRDRERACRPRRALASAPTSRKPTRRRTTCPATVRGVRRRRDLDVVQRLVTEPDGVPELRAGHVEGERAAPLRSRRHLDAPVDAARPRSARAACAAPAAEGRGRGQRRRAVAPRRPGADARRTAPPDHPSSEEPVATARGDRSRAPSPSRTSTPSCAPGCTGAGRRRARQRVARPRRRARPAGRGRKSPRRPLAPGAVGGAARRPRSGGTCPRSRAARAVHPDRGRACRRPPRTRRARSPVRARHAASRYTQRASADPRDVLLVGVTRDVPGETGRDEGRARCPARDRDTVGERGTTRRRGGPPARGGTHEHVGLRGATARCRCGHRTAYGSGSLGRSRGEAVVDVALQARNTPASG